MCKVYVTNHSLYIKEEQLGNSEVVWAHLEFIGIRKDDPARSSTGRQKKRGVQKKKCAVNIEKKK